MKAPLLFPNFLSFPLSDVFILFIGGIILIVSLSIVLLLWGLLVVQKRNYLQTKKDSPPEVDNTGEVAPSVNDTGEVAAGSGT